MDAIECGKDLEYVGFWARVGATILDTLLIALITIPSLVSIYGVEYFDSDKTGLIAGPSDFLISWVFPFVLTVLFWVWRQATPGKMIVSAHVVDAKTGKSISVGQAMGRYVAYFLSMLPLGLGLIWVAIDPRKQGWHDKVAGTVVVRHRRAGSHPVTFEKE
ncbi:MAG: RDD family protein [Lysobacter sp.]|nr:RDD family protein [Lysobacter sp.]